MLCVKTQIKPSQISGIGLFAFEFIPKGEIVWKYEPLLDVLLSEADTKAFSETARKQFFHYAFFDDFHKKYMLCGDDGRFFNHSDSPNCDDSLPNITIAIRDIQPGEELTVDYRDFYGDLDNYPGNLSFISKKGTPPSQVKHISV